jgi:hypothetical protein
LRRFRLIARADSSFPSIRIYRGPSRKDGLPWKGITIAILLVDPDLGFVFWLGHTLDSAGYNAIPAKDVDAALELLEEHKLAVDILVIDPLLPDAFAFIAHLRRFRPTAHVIAAVPPEWQEGAPVPGADAAIRKLGRFSPEAAAEWVNLIQKLSAGGGSSFKSSGSQWS